MAFRLRTGSLVVALLVVPVAEASAELPLLPTPTTVDFAAFTAAGFVPAPAAGQLDSDFWVVRGVSDGDLPFGGTGNAGDYARGASVGNVATGGVWAFDVGPAVALGANPTSGDFTSGSFVLRVSNETGETLNDIAVVYDIWHNNNGNRSNSFAFAWSIDDSSYNTVGSLGFTTPQGEDVVGWVSDTHETTISGLDLADGDNIFLRWTFDSVAGGGDEDEFAIDDITITGQDICGNGVQENGEECDDGNANDTDACVEGCLDASCGDGFVQGGVEGCDDGNMSNTDACPDGAGGTCENAVCGDGFTQAGVEDCDDANADNGDACVAGCLDASCGDGFVQGGVEGCDDGNMDNTDACPDGGGGTCEAAVCGDGFTQAGVEECDDGDADNTNACANDCTANVVATTGTETGTTATTTTDTEGSSTDGTTMSVDESGTTTTDGMTTGGTGSGTTTTDGDTTDGPTSSSTSPTTTTASGTGGATDSDGFEGEDPPGCGCRSGSGGGWLLPALFGVAAIARRREFN